LTPRKNSPRETELRIFSELGQNLGEALQEPNSLSPVQRPEPIGENAMWQARLILD